LKTLEKWLWSQKPAAKAVSASKAADAASCRLACSYATWSSCAARPAGHPRRDSEASDVTPCQVTPMPSRYDRHRHPVIRPAAPHSLKCVVIRSALGDR
jgi:hypothetical protein